MQFGDFRNVGPIHLQRFVIISFSNGSWFVLSNRMLQMVSGQRSLSILSRQLCGNASTFLMIVVLVLQIETPIR